MGVRVLSDFTPVLSAVADHCPSGPGDCAAIVCAQVWLHLPLRRLEDDEYGFGGFQLRCRREPRAPHRNDRRPPRQMGSS